MIGVGKGGFAAVVLVAGLWAGGAAAQEAAPECETRGTNGMVTLVLCPPDLGLEALAAAGREACGDRRPCGAWIWDDAEEMPAEVPAVHDGLTEEQVTAAEAVWVAEDGNLITIGATPDEGAPMPPAAGADDK